MSTISTTIWPTMSISNIRLFGVMTSLRRKSGKLKRIARTSGSSNKAVSLCTSHSTSSRSCSCSSWPQWDSLYLPSSTCWSYCQRWKMELKSLSSETSSKVKILMTSRMRLMRSRRNSNKLPINWKLLTRSSKKWAFLNQRTSRRLKSIWIDRLILCWRWTLTSLSNGS